MSSNPAETRFIIVFVFRLNGIFFAKPLENMKLIHDLPYCFKHVNICFVPGFEPVASTSKSTLHSASVIVIEVA